MPMAGRSKIDPVSGPPPLPASRRSKAKSNLYLNLLATPGWGSYAAGWKVTGVLQILLAIAGVVLTLAWFISFLIEWSRDWVLPTDGGEYLRWALMGMGLFAAAWLWALATSLQILREARKTDA
jgi:hypothetical protein